MVRGRVAGALYRLVWIHFMGRGHWLYAWYFLVRSSRPSVGAHKWRLFFIVKDDRLLGLCVFFLTPTVLFCFFA